MYSAGISMTWLSASIVWRRMYSYCATFMSRGAGIERNVSITPSARAASNAALVVVIRVRSHVELEHPHRVLAEEARPHVVAERDIGKLGEDAVEGEAHREVPRVHDLVGAARVRIVHDVRRVVLRCERARRVVEVGPLEHELHREVRPWLTTVPGDELELGEEPANLVDERDVLRRERHPRSWHARAHADGDVELNALGVDRVELLVVDRDLRRESRGK